MIMTTSFQYSGKVDDFKERLTTLVMTGRSFSSCFSSIVGIGSLVQDELDIALMIFLTSSCHFFKTTQFTAEMKFVKLNKRSAFCKVINSVSNLVDFLNEK